MDTIKQCMANCFSPKKATATDDELNNSVSARYKNQVRQNLNISMPMPMSPPAAPNPNTVATPSSSKYAKVGSHRPRPSEDMGDGSEGGPWEKSRLRDTDMTVLFNQIHDHISHHKYAISGLAAMVDHGLTQRCANRVSIVCPEESKDNIRLWAKTQGDVISKHRSSDVGIPMPDGSVRQVRIRFLDSHSFDQLRIMQSRVSRARVLSLASTLDLIAESYIKEHDRPTRDHAHAVERMTADMFWILRHTTKHRIELPPHLLAAFLSERGFELFTSKNCDARAEMQIAGIDIAAVLRNHRARGEIRDHEQLLAQFGAPPFRGDDAVPEALRPFAGMATLGAEGELNRDSMYTVCSKPSYGNLGTVAAGQRQQQQNYGGGGGGGNSRALSGTVRPPPRRADEERHSSELVSGMGTPHTWV